METSTKGAIVYAVIMAAVFLAAIFGNLLILLAVYRTSTLKRTTAVILIVNLASVDLLVSLFVVPFVITVVVTRTWELPDFLCVATGFLNAFLTAAQLLALFHISVNRYIAVAFPHSYETRCSKQFTLLMVTAGWIYSFFWTLMPFFGWGKFGFEKGSLYCNILWSKDHQEYAIVLQTTCYIVPAILAFILYAIVYRKVRSRSKKFLKSFGSTFSLSSLPSTAKGQNDDLNDSVSCDSARNSHQVSNARLNAFTDAEWQSDPTSSVKPSKKRKAMEIRVTRTLLAVGFCFAIFWIPRGVANLWAAFTSRENVPKALELVSTAFIFANSAVHPLIYAALHREFCNAFKELLCCTSGKNASGFNNNSGSVKANGISVRQTMRKSSVQFIEKMAKKQQDIGSIQTIDNMPSTPIIRSSPQEVE